CRCVCGTTIVVFASNLTRDHSKSCGCQRIPHKEIKHGMSRTPTYKSYESMKQRCLNPNATGYEIYGGRGIKVCDRWLESFEIFLADMGERPEGMTIDRVDRNGNYEPSNCRWATVETQQN